MIVGRYSMLMQWPIRNQIFFPFALLLIISVSLVALVAAWNTSQQSRQQKLNHMQSVADALGDAQFPLTQDIVDRISAMVGGEVIVAGPSGQVVAATIRLSSLPQPLQDLADQEEKVTDEVTVLDQPYIVTMIPRRRVPRPGPLFVLKPQQDVAWQWQAIAPLVYVAIPTLLVAVVLALLIARGLAGRVDRLRSLFGRLSQGDYQKVDVSGRNDELRDLLFSANNLSARLEQMQLELQKSERLGLLSQLSGGLAHQLRNSIAGAKMAVQLHQQSCPQEDSEMLPTAMSQLRLTEEQVQAVLSLRSENERDARPTVVNLTELIDNVRDLLRPQSTHWKTDLQVLRSDSPVNVRLRSELSLRGAMLNIVLNAVEATGTEGCVVIETVVDGGDVTVSVRDNGPGFSFDTESLTQVFHTTKPEGIGLGLTIAQHAVAQENGQFAIDRRNGWTEVSIRLHNLVVDSNTEVNS